MMTRYMFVSFMVLQIDVPSDCALALLLVRDKSAQELLMASCAWLR